MVGAFLGDVFGEDGGIGGPVRPNVQPGVGNLEALAGVEVILEELVWSLDKEVRRETIEVKQT